MKTRKALSLFFCTVAFAAGAATVSIDTAKRAAGSWAISDASLGVPHGPTVSGATAYDVDGATGFYAVSLEGGGTLFLAADDEIGPILAFTAESNPDLSAESPLLNLLSRDVKARRGVVAEGSEQINLSSRGSFKATGSSTVAGAASQRGDAAQTAKKLWALFTATEEQSSGQSGPVKFGAMAEAREVIADSDMRVAPILTTQWSQTRDKAGKNCYNYYTPQNYPCGCVATAAGQILNRWQYPTGDLTSFSTSECTVDDVPTDLDSTNPRHYYWDLMVDKPGAATSDESRQAIGALLYDLGISFRASYSSGSTGAYEYDVPGPLHNLFNYASAYTYSSRRDADDPALHTAPMRQRIILANLDARRPVELYIMSNKAGGHAVVADGYGYVTIGGEEVEFTHINMGWAGTDDMWYNLPIVQTKEAGSTAGQSGGYTFELLMGATFNIHPTETGDLLTGRIVEDGEPVEGAIVTVRNAGSSTDIATTTSDAKGIYSFCLQGGNEYDVFAVSADGKKTGALANILLMETAVAYSDYTTYSASDVGNSWGNDIDIAIPYVRVVVGTETNFYNNLNTALEAAATKDDPVVEVFGPTRLKNPVTIVTNMTIRIVADPASDYPTIDDCIITILDAAVSRGGWALQVAEGARVNFSNVVFTAESDAFPFVDVKASGAVSVAGKIGIGTVVTRTEDAFVLAGAFELVGAGGLAVAYADAKDRFSQFGVYECSDADAVSCAKLILDALDPALTGATGDGGTLVWDRVSIDPTRAIAYATNDAIGVTHYLSIDLLFQDYTNGAEIVFLKDCPADMFTNAVVLADSVTIRSEAGTPVVVTLGKDAGFTVQGEDTELVFTNVVFTRSESSSVNLVTVRDGASFTLADGATIANLKSSGTASAVYVEKGLVTMQDGSAITNCVATRQAKSKAGGVYLKGGDCTFDFAGGLITGCRTGSNSSTGFAGGVFAEIGATVYVSGSASAYGNKAGVNATETQNLTRNIYVPGFDKLILSGGLTGDDIGVYCVSGNANGASFATIGDGVAAADAELSSVHFRNDYNAKLYATTNAATLVWAAEPPGPKPVPEDEAEARIVVGGSTAAYATVSNAFEAAALHNAEAIELLKDASLSNSIVVVSSVVLDGKGFTLDRAGDFCISVPSEDVSLVVTNIVLYGGTGKGRLLDVLGGSLVLDADTVISGVTGSDKSMVAPVVIWDGSLVMNPGVEISGCSNNYDPPPGGSLTAGAILVNGPNAHVEFLGGTITGCTGARAGGVTIANNAEVRVSGDLQIKNNKLISGEDGNLVVHDNSRLVLADFLAGRVGYTEGVGGDTNVFGTVDADFLASTTASNLVVSARRFRHDLTDAKGVVATNETEALLVWSSAVGDSTEFTNVVDNVTNVYDVVTAVVDEDEPEIVVCESFAFAAIEEVTPGTWKLTLTNGTEYCIYTLFGSADLKNWSEAGKKNPLAGGDISGEDHEFVFEVNDSSGTQFWKVEGADGTKNP